MTLDTRASASKESRPGGKPLVFRYKVLVRVVYFPPRQANVSNKFICPSRDDITNQRQPMMRPQPNKYHRMSKTQPAVTEPIITESRLRLVLIMPMTELSPGT